MALPGGVPPSPVLAALDRLADARLARLLELLCLGKTLTRADAEQTLDPVPLSELIDADVLENVDAGVRSRVTLHLVDGVILAGDRDWGGADSVTGSSPAAMAVAHSTIRRDVRSALDVGTGSGVQALLISKYAERVVGTDINPHALSFARMNQRLNAVTNTTWIEGSWFEPAQGERFDLVVGNPPVVVSPDNEIIARDSPVGGAEISRQVVREAADHLTEGGFATVMCNWPHGEGKWEDDPREWLTGLPCDALLIGFGSHPSIYYAMSQLRELAERDAELAAETIKRWSDYYTSIGAERITNGVIVLRRRAAGPGWIRAFQADGSPTGAGGNQLERMFAAGDFFASSAGPGGLRDLLSTAWRPADGHRLEQALVHEDGSYVTGPAVLRHEPGIRVSARVDPRVVPLINACDGGFTLGQLLAAMPPPEGLDQGEFQQLCLPAVRDLIARGYLVGDGWPV